MFVVLVIHLMHYTRDTCHESMRTIMALGNDHQDQEGFWQE